MDFITRQFIVLAKKFRKELRRALSDLQRALYQQSEAIREATSAYKNAKHPDFVVHAELNVPEAQQRAENTHREQQVICCSGTLSSQVSRCSR